MYILTRKKHELLHGATIYISYFIRYWVFPVTILISTERPYGLVQRIICVCRPCYPITTRQLFELDFFKAAVSCLFE